MRPFAFANSLLEGQTATTTCLSLVSGVQFKWLKNGIELLEERPRVSILTSDPVSTLIVKQVSATDAANYTCIASNSFGNDKFTASLVISSKPKWLVEPRDVIIGQGMDTVLNCVAIASPPAKVTWWLGDQKSE